MCTLQWEKPWTKSFSSVPLCPIPTAPPLHVITSCYSDAPQPPEKSLICSLYRLP